MIEVETQQGSGDVFQFQPRQDDVTQSNRRRMGFNSLMEHALSSSKTRGGPGPSLRVHGNSGRAETSEAEMFTLNSVSSVFVSCSPQRLIP